MYAQGFYEHYKDSNYGGEKQKNIFWIYKFKPFIPKANFFDSLMEETYDFNCEFPIPDGIDELQDEIDKVANTAVQIFLAKKGIEFCIQPDANVFCKKSYIYDAKTKELVDIEKQHEKRKLEWNKTMEKCDKFEGRKTSFTDYEYLEKRKGNNENKS